MEEYTTRSPEETEAVAASLAACLTGGNVVALYGGLGMGKTAFVRGLAAGRGLAAEVSSPTFALVHEYGGQPPLVHFDMYRVEGWDDLDTTGYFDYLSAGAILAVEWSERIEKALPAEAIRVRFERLGDSERRITIEGGEQEGGGKR
ncbi:MAG: tRNA (adenosine(37)-N6)-threonylcarbamoyltransferase complex ATPase subunit type 1 TsaE [Clostridiales bacterium]|nr:tRNA (adenosine(37)-N6)-threonylcarbamoyltransferase complex ATPase subunit type 1 TsaE [Clostridiales bacterium]